jgi:hypothetical protein
MVQGASKHFSASTVAPRPEHDATASHEHPPQKGAQRRGDSPQRHKDTKENSKNIKNSFASFLCAFVPLW